MLSVIVKINGKAITGRSCYNTGIQNKKGEYIYNADDGRKLTHAREKGAVALAIKLLKGIKE